MPISAPDVTEEIAPGDRMTTDAEALADLKRSSPLVISISQLAALGMVAQRDRPAARQVGLGGPHLKIDHAGPLCILKTLST